jgi:hypothetical protein
VPPWGGVGSAQNPYFLKLLRLSFAKTEATDGPVDVQIYPENLSSARFMADLKNNATVDVVWTGTSLRREQDFLPIYISLLGELNDYRVLLIRRADQEKFTAIQSLADLGKFTAGAGADWPSADILRYNTLPVVVVNNINLLFPMLKAKRFDYISRNMLEAWPEAVAFEKDGLSVESTLLLHGGVPFYFFVHKDNKKLADRIDRGLKAAIADGSFNELLFGLPEFKRGSEEIKPGKRRLIELHKKLILPE